MNVPSRRQVLLGLCSLSASLVGCVGGGDDSQQTPTHVADLPAGDHSLSGLSVGLSTVTEGLVAPVGVERPVGERRYVLDQPGKVYLVTDDGRETFLDLTGRIPSVGGYDERGLLGLAFHPSFESNGRFFVRYSAPPDDALPAGYSHWAVLSEFRADPAARRVDPTAERRLLAVPQPQPNHNGGDVVFGPEGYLYVAFGDGGGAGDAGLGHVEDWYEGAGGGNGQDVRENLLGSILRLDVDGGDPYAVPPENPLVGREGLDEQYAWGFRDPWGMAFGANGHLFVADTGQNRYEEVDIVVAGGNYGWNVREGTRCFRAETCPTETGDDERLRSPVIEYSHEGGAVSGLSVVGGYPCDGSALPAFEGAYLFADWKAQGKLFAASPTPEGLWETTTVPIVDDVAPHVLAFGRGGGELYLCTNRRGRVAGKSGAVHRLEPA